MNKIVLCKPLCAFFSSCYDEVHNIKWRLYNHYQSISEDPVLVKDKTSFVSSVYAGPTCQCVLFKVLKAVVVVEVVCEWKRILLPSSQVDDRGWMHFGELLSSPHTEGITKVCLFPSSGCFESESGAISVFVLVCIRVHIHSNTDKHTSILTCICRLFKRKC